MPKFNPTATQRMRARLLELDQPAVVVEALDDTIRDIETRYGESLEDHDTRIRLLEIAEQNRLTKTGVWTIVKGKIEDEAIDWWKWAVRGVLATVGAALVAATSTGLYKLIMLAWKGANT
jgi:hypothetical protein